MTYQEYCLNELGYETLTTYFEDLSIAERFGNSAIEDTVKRAIKYDSDYKSLTELTMVLNHKIWFTYEKNTALAKLYQKLWDVMCQFVETHFTQEQLEYYYRVTD